MQNLYTKDNTPINLLQDSDIEYGSNENGFYEKHSNGNLIQWGTVEKNITIKNNYGGMFYDDGYGIAFPLNFIDNTYSISITSSNSSNCIFVYSCKQDTENRAGFNLISPVAVENANNFKFNWIAIGRWK